MELLDPLALIPETHRRLKVAEYHQMIEAGIFNEDDHIELLDGVLVAMTPQGHKHARVTQRLTSLLVHGAGPAFEVRVQLPLTLSELSEPEPDLAVVPANEFGEGENHPTTAPLVVEISRSSLKKDRIIKRALYARASITEYWIIHVESERIEVLRDPDPASGSYRAVVMMSGDDVLIPSTLPGPRLRVRDLFAR